MNEYFDLRNLLVEEEEVQPAYILNIGVRIFEYIFDETQEDLEFIREKTISLLKEKFYFRKQRRRKMREGFLNIERIEDLISCIYAKESPIKISYVGESLIIQESRIKLITPSYSVKINLDIFHDRARIVLFGGKDNLINRAARYMEHAIRGGIKGTYRDITSAISQENMKNILNNLENVQYIWIDPGDSDRFISVTKKRIGDKIKEVIEYKVDTKLRGTRITMAPIVEEIIEEEGIKIREIQGRMKFGRREITTRISSFGRILFTIPTEMVPQGGSIYDISERFYRRMLTFIKSKRK
ncbi:MAG: hypothetical protein ACFFDN_30120 [Candidatus Hodarchaeota archaeon]